MRSKLGIGGDEKVAKGPLQLRRGKDPISEFDSNGLTLMLLFRHVFPLARWKSVYAYKRKDEVSALVATYSAIVREVEDDAEQATIEHLLTSWKEKFVAKGAKGTSRRDKDAKIENVERELILAIEAVSDDDASKAK